MSDRTTGSRQSPSYVHRPDQSRHHLSVSSIRDAGGRASGSGPWDGYQASVKGTLSPAGHGEVAHGAEVLSPDGHRRPQPEGVGSPDRADPVVLAAHPRNPGPEVQPDGQLDPHGHGAARALDHADQGRRRRPDRHAVAQHDDAVRGLELGLEDQRPRAIAPAHGPHGARRRDEPPAVLGRAEERREAGGRIEAGNAEPVDRAVPPDEGRCLAVSDDRVVLDAQRHAVGSPHPENSGPSSPFVPRARVDTPRRLGTGFLSLVCATHRARARTSRRRSTVERRDHRLAPRRAADHPAGHDGVLTTPCRVDRGRSPRWRAASASSAATVSLERGHATRLASGRDALHWHASCGNSKENAGATRPGWSAVRLGRGRLRCP